MTKAGIEVMARGAMGILSQLMVQPDLRERIINAQSNDSRLYLICQQDEEEREEGFTMSSEGGLLGATMCPRRWTHRRRPPD